MNLGHMCIRSVCFLTPQRMPELKFSVILLVFASWLEISRLTVMQRYSQFLQQSKNFAFDETLLKKSSCISDSISALKALSFNKGNVTWDAGPFWGNSKMKYTLDSLPLWQSDIWIPCKKSIFSSPEIWTWDYIQLNWKLLWFPSAFCMKRLCVSRMVNLGKYSSLDAARSWLTSCCCSCSF